MLPDDRPIIIDTAEFAELMRVSPRTVHSWVYRRMLHQGAYLGAGKFHYQRIVDFIEKGILFPKYSRLGYTNRILNSSGGSPSGGES